MAAVTDDVAVASATVAVVEEVVVPSSGTEKEEVEVEVNGNSKVVEKAAAVVKEKRVNAPREKKAKATVPKEKKQKQEKVVKEKKPKIAKAANPSVAASHPSYLLVRNSCVFLHVMVLTVGEREGFGLEGSLVLCFSPFFWVLWDLGLLMSTSLMEMVFCPRGTWQMVKEAIGTLKERTGSSQYAIAKYLEDTYKTGLPPNFKKILSVQLRNLTKQGKLYKVKNSFKLSDDLKKPIKAPKSVVANKDAPKAIKAAAPKPTKVAKKKGPAAGRVKKSKAASNGATPKAAKPVKAPKSPAKASKLETKAAKPSKAAPPAAASKKSSEEKVVPVTKPVAPPARKAPTVRKTATPKKVATPKKKGPKSVKTAKPKVTTRAATPSKVTSKAAAVKPPPAKKAKKT